MSVFPTDTTRHNDGQKLGYRLWCVMEGVTNDREGWFALDHATKNKFIAAAAEFLLADEVQAQFPDALGGIHDL